MVVYELDTPLVTDLAAALTEAAQTSKLLGPLFAASNPVASQAVTEWQVYNSDSADLITLGGVAQSGDHSASSCATVSSLSTVALLAGAAACSDTVDVRAFNGSYWGDWQSLAVTVTAASAPPKLGSQTANQSWAQGQKISLALPAGTFTDPQNQTLSYAASQSSGQALPSWLSFNAATRTFSGTVPAGMESLVLKVTATDTSGLSASESFGVTVAAAAPALTSQTASQAWLQGQKVSLALAANTFTDPQSQTLKYGATQSNGQALPSWLSFNATTRAFSGTVPAGMASLVVKVTATDTSGLAASESFGITVAAAAPALTSQTTNQTWPQGQKVSLALAANTFTDPQSETLSYSAKQSSGSALPSWLSFNAATRTFSGSVPAGVESLALKVTATDSSGLSGTEVFDVTAPAAAAAKSALAAGGDVIAISRAQTMLFSAANADQMQFISGSASENALVQAGGNGFAGFGGDMRRPIGMAGALQNNTPPATGAVRWFDLQPSHGTGLLAFTSLAGSFHYAPLS